MFLSWPLTDLSIWANGRHAATIKKFYGSLQKPGKPPVLVLVVVLWHRLCCASTRAPTLSTVLVLVPEHPPYPLAEYSSQGWTGQHFFASGRGGAGQEIFFLGRGRDQNSRGGAFSGRGKQYVNAEVNVLFWFGIFTLQYTLFSIIFCKPLFILAPILRVIFAIPAASSKSEQVFSVAGRVVTLDWNRLAPEMVEVQSATAEKHALCVKNLLALRLIWLLLFNIYVLILSSQL